MSNSARSRSCSDWTRLNRASSSSACRRRFCADSIRCSAAWVASSARRRCSVTSACSPPTSSRRASRRVSNASSSSRCRASAAVLLAVARGGPCQDAHLGVASAVSRLAVVGADGRPGVGVPVAFLEGGQRNGLAELAAALVVAALRVRQAAVGGGLRERGARCEPGAPARLVHCGRQQGDGADASQLSPRTLSARSSAFSSRMPPRTKAGTSARPADVSTATTSPSDTPSASAVA